MANPASRLLVAGYLSVDTVVQPDGRGRRQAGGAALFAALGARHAGASVDLCASVGSDYPPQWLSALDAVGIGLAGVARKAVPSRWAQIRHEADGARRSTHFGDPRWWEASERHAPALPDDLGGCGLVVACPMPATALEALLDAAEVAGLPVVADLSEAFVREERSAILALVPRLAVLAPSREETRLLLPDLCDDEAARRLAELGPAVLQKRGAQGAYGVEAGGGDGWHLPAPAARLVDPTGAGDATVGAFAGARLAGGDLRGAAQAALAIGALAVSGHGAAALCPALHPFPVIQAMQGVLAR
ncbi:carbohydrate kinase family protein [Aurantimonas sp. Leaf443]|uniref:carbohydrate kinase family protein n=1 Tax=Aurantimonas sp. Leaf443 TaxID=1736378 RepID=UPI0006F1D838|nr:carbohydrate kinase family protein [Aurantimonas sp. Leaf443]KQT83829.1 hypothetical protein ASG48_10530 [Aurantimonas sp. Leaf443]